MSLVSQITALANAVASDIRALRTQVNGRAVDLDALTTTNKSNLVAAINEVNDKPAGTDGATINDSNTVSTSTVWSSSKVAGSAVRYDAAQTLTVTQRDRATNNLNIGVTETDFATSYATARDAA